MNFVKNNLPKISDTEQAAIDAGDSYIEAEIINGTFDWHKWLQSDLNNNLSVVEKNFLDIKVSKMLSLVDEWQDGNRLELDTNLLDFLSKEGFFAMNIAKEYGGAGFSAYAQSCIIKKIATHSLSVGVIAMVPNSLGPGELLMNYGTDKQKSEFLPKLAKGDHIPCFALTSLLGGSDASSMQDYGLVENRVVGGVNQLGISLYFSKRYITLAPVATLIGLAFKLYDPNKLLSDKIEIGITVALLPSDTDGVKISKHLPMHQFFPNGSIQGENIFITMDMIIGGHSGLGKGWGMLMECLSSGRGISLPSLAAATSQLCLQTTPSYALAREQFKLPIGFFDGIKEKLSSIAIKSFLIESMRCVTASAIDSGLKPAIASAIVKYHSTEFARNIVINSMDIHAGKTILLGPKNYLANTYCAQPISITVEGANILTRNLIIIGQGTIRSHPYLIHEINAAQSSDLRLFDKYFFKHIGCVVQKISRGIFHGFTMGWFLSVKENSKFAFEIRILQLFNLNFALLLESMFLALGGKLKQKENLSAKLGDIVSDLYIAACVLKYDKNHSGVFQENYIGPALHFLLARINQSFKDIYNNFPIKLLGRIQYWATLPFGVFGLGRDFGAENNIAAESYKNSNALDILLENCSTLHPQVQSLIKIRALFKDVYPVKQKVLKLLKNFGLDGYHSYEDRLHLLLDKKYISSNELQLLIDYDKLVQEVLAVDSFYINKNGGL